MEYQPDGSAGSVTLRLRSRIVDLGEANSLNYNNLPYIVSRPPPFGPAIAFPGAEFVSPLATGTPDALRISRSRYICFTSQGCA